MANFMEKLQGRHPDTVGALRQWVTRGDPSGHTEPESLANCPLHEQFPAGPSIHATFENEPPRARLQNDAKNIASQELEGSKLEAQLNTLTNAASGAWGERPDPHRIRDLLDASAQPTGFQPPPFHSAPSIQELSQQQASAPLHIGSSTCSYPEQHDAAEVIRSTKAAARPRSRAEVSVARRLWGRFYTGIITLIVAGLSIALLASRIDPAAKNGASVDTVQVQQAPALARSVDVQQQVDAMATAIAAVRQTVDQLGAQMRDIQEELSSIKASQQDLRQSTAALTQRLQKPGRDLTRYHLRRSR